MRRLGKQEAEREAMKVKAQFAAALRDAYKAALPHWEDDPEAHGLLIEAAYHHVHEAENFDGAAFKAEALKIIADAKQRQFMRLPEAARYQQAWTSQ